MLSIIISMYVCMYALLIMYILHSHTHTKCSRYA